VRTCASSSLNAEIVICLSMTLLYHTRRYLALFSVRYCQYNPCPPEQMEDILDQIYLAGLNNGMYAARQDDDSILDTNPFDLHWLAEQAEKAIRFETDEEG